MVLRVYSSDLYLPILSFMSPSNSNFGPEHVQSFLKWVENLALSDQEVLISLVYREKKVRDVVHSLSTMAADQRQEVFERLGLPQELLTRMPPPDPALISDVDVEWVDWQAASRDS